MSDSPSETADGATRRSVLRAGAVGVWAAPVVTVVAAAPALAASGAVALSVTLQPVERLPASNNAGNLNTLRVVATVSNSGAPTTALTVRVTVTPTGEGNFTGTTSSDDVVGFKELPRDDVRTPDQTFTYLATSQLASNGTVGFNPTIVLSLSIAGRLTVTADPGGSGTAGVASVDFT